MFKFGKDSYKDYNFQVRLKSLQKTFSIFFYFNNNYYRGHQSKHRGNLLDQSTQNLLPMLFTYSLMSFLFGTDHDIDRPRDWSPESVID